MKASPLQKIGPFLILSYGLLVIYYYITGLLAFLVNPFYNGLIITAAIILIGLGIYWILNLKHYLSKSCETSSGIKEIILILLLVMPLIFAPIFKPQLLSSASALSRGVSSDLSSSTFDPTVFAKPTEDRSLIEWVRILNVDPEPDHYNNQKVSVQGKVILEENYEAGHFQIGQFVMTCCAADARVIALPVFYNPNDFKLKKDDWIRLKGIIAEGLIDGHRQIVIQLESMESTPIPNEAYEILK